MVITDEWLTLATIFNDAPILRWDAVANFNWRRRNPPQTYAGYLRQRRRLGLSKNVVMVRAMKVDYTAEYLQRFGFLGQGIVYNESLALGSSSFTSLQQEWAMLCWPTSII